MDASRPTTRVPDRKFSTAGGTASVPDEVMTLTAGGTVSVSEVEALFELFKSISGSVFEGELISKVYSPFFSLCFPTLSLLKQSSVICTIINCLPWMLNVKDYVCSQFEESDLHSILNYQSFSPQTSINPLIFDAMKKMKMVKSLSWDLRFVAVLEGKRGHTLHFFPLSYRRRSNFHFFFSLPSTEQRTLISFPIFCKMERTTKSESQVGEEGD